MSWTRSAGLILRALDRRLLLGLSVLTVLLAFIAPASIWLTKTATDEVVATIAQKSGVENVLFLVLTLGAVLFGAEVITHIKEHLSEVLNLRLTRSLREKIAVKTSALDVEQFQDPEILDSLERSKDDIQWRPSQLLFSASGLLTGVLGLVASVAVLLNWNPWISLLILCAALPPLILEMIMARDEWKLEHERTQLERRSDYFFDLLSSPNSVPELKSYNAQPLLLKAFATVLDKLLGYDLRLAKRHLFMGLGVGIFSLVATAAVIVLAVFHVVSEGSVGQFAGYLVALTAVRASMTQASQSLSDFYENKLYMDEIVRFLDAPERIVTTGSALLRQPIQQGLEVSNLSFSYPRSKTPSLNEVSFSVRPGEILGVVGANGAGKSTLIRLVNRLYNAPKRSIFLDGRPLEDFDLNDLRRNISVIHQDYQRYEMSVSENLTIGCGERWGDDTAAREAARKGGADSLIASLPKGYKQQLGQLFDDSRPLSGGQWQLLAISRALASSPQILILDEPTASFDAMTETRIFENLRQAAEGTMCLLVSHRFSTLRMADRIIVLEEGRLTEQGTHEELLSLDGTYAHMYNLQAAGYR